MIAPLCERLCDANDVGFLKGVAAQSCRPYLSGDYHQRCAVHISVAKPGDYVSGTRTGCDNHNAGFAGDAGKSLCSVNGALFVANKNISDFFLVVVEHVEHWYYGTSGIAECGVDTFGDE